MLAEVRELQNCAIVKLCELTASPRREIVFKAPTGSGKTHMMADFMNRVLSTEPGTVFIVSSLSKGDLARQNYDKFCEYQPEFSNLDPFLINSEAAEEERLFIPDNHNVYVLPRDLYKEKSRIKDQGVMANFLFQLRMKNGGYKIILIKDECHIATKNLDELNPYFTKIINFSATPKLERGQYPDVEITQTSAQNVKLIKVIEWGDDDAPVDAAIDKLCEIRKDYINLLNINPCLIIQISNKDKAEEEWNTILPKLEQHNLKWMKIFGAERESDTNDVMKAKKLPFAKWKDYARENNSAIDVIVFKMVISEGWDIPRACMLYQVRDSKSKQMDEQVMGRVRRNPRLMDFEKLSNEAQHLAMTAYIWGIAPAGLGRAVPINLLDAAIQTEVQIKTTKLKPLSEKTDFDIKKFIEHESTKEIVNSSIFNLWRKWIKVQPSVQEMCWKEISVPKDFIQIAGVIDKVDKESTKFECDYTQSMELATTATFTMRSYYTKSDYYTEIADWVWAQKKSNKEFSFDSQAEKEFAQILRELAHVGAAQAKVGGRKTKTVRDLTGTHDEIISDTPEQYLNLWGKNFLPNSEIKFQYYLGGQHESYPDFIMKDKLGRIHIFEVKSANKSGKIDIDNILYKAKVKELKKCYGRASALTDQMFYLPIQDGDDWQIFAYIRGQERIMNKDMFVEFVQGEFLM